MGDDRVRKEHVLRHCWMDSSDDYLKDFGLSHNSLSSWGKKMETQRRYRIIRGDTKNSNSNSNKLTKISRL